jgi:hypothetical protein
MAKGIEFLHGQGIHVGPQSNGAVGVTTFDNANHPGRAHAPVDRNAPFSELLRYNISRADLFKTQFRVCMNIASYAGNIR